MKIPAEIFSAVICTIAAAGGTYACYLAAGPRLGLFFGGFIVATVVNPFAIVMQRGLIHRIISLIGVSAGIAAIWLIAIFKTPDTPGQWAQLSIALFFYGGAIGGIAIVLGRIRIPPAIAAGAAIVIGLAWLSWPIWLCSSLVSLPCDIAPAWAGRMTGPIVMPQIASGLTLPHPLLTSNGVLIEESPWSEKSLAYRWTNLNQDIPTQLPASALACIVLHGSIAFSLFALASIAKRMKSDPSPQPQ